MLETRVDSDHLHQDSYLLSPLPNFEGILVANGLGASGLTAELYLGAELAKLALGQTIELDLNDYDVAGAIE